MKKGTSIYGIVDLFAGPGGLSRLMFMFPDAGFNKRTRNEYERIRDFIILHHKATLREDTPFWKYVKHMDVPDKLLEKMEIYKENGRIFREDNELFNETSWFAVMNGQNLRTKGWHPVVDGLKLKEVRDRLAEIHATVQNSANVMSSHKGFIDQFLSGALE